MVPRRASARGQVVPSSAASETSSPLFHSLVERMDEDSRYEILDLGPATPENIAFFGRYHCRLNIADCLTDLVALHKDEEDVEAQLGERVRSMLPPHADRRFDIVLAWDVLNYLDKAVLRALIEDLSGSIDHNTQLHAYVYPRQSMPERPSRFRIFPDGSLAITPGAPAERPSPCYLQPELEKLMPGLTVQRSVLLKNGIQEYLFRGR
jgi:hypothetical protein